MNCRTALKYLPILAAAVALGVVSRPAQAQETGNSISGVTVAGGWIHTTAKAGGNAAGFFTIQNTGQTADTLVSASCPIAHSTELVDGSGNKVDAVEIKAGKTLKLTDDTAHIMLRKNRFRLFPKAMVPCSVDFRNAGKMILYLYVEPKNAGNYHRAYGTPVAH